jgi:hypothetical protein
MGARSILLLSIGLASAGRPASAADVVQRSAAQALFEQARGELERGELDAACEHFDASRELEPTPGTLLNLAVCREKQGKTASAYLDYEEALALAVRNADGERQVIARARMAELEPRLHRVEILVPEWVPASWFLTLDGTTLAAAVLSTPIPVDQGVHTITYGAPGYRSATLTFRADAPGETSKIELKPFEVFPLPQAPPTRPAEHTVALTPPPASPEPGRPWFGAGIAFGAGVTATALGTYFGLAAASHWDQRNAHCSPAGCSPEGMRDGHRARTEAVVSNVCFALALAGVATGVALLLAHPRHAESTPRATTTLHDARRGARR